MEAVQGQRGRIPTFGSDEVSNTDLSYLVLFAKLESAENMLVATVCSVPTATKFSRCHHDTKDTANTEQRPALAQT